MFVDYHSGTIFLIPQDHKINRLKLLISGLYQLFRNVLWWSTIFKNGSRSTDFGNSQFSPVSQMCPTLCDPMNRSTPSFPVYHQLPEFTQTHVHRVGDAIQPSHPLSSPSPPAPNPSQHQGLFNESTLCMRCPKFWSFSFNISPSNEHPGLISFRMDWLVLLVRRFSSIFSNTTVQKHQFFVAQLSS